MALHRNSYDRHIIRLLKQQKTGGMTTMTNRESHEATYERRTSETATKHDPECDCGICQYCNGDEDKFGNPTKKGEREMDELTDAIKRMLILECSECDEARTENLQNVLLHACAFETRQFAKTAWKRGWIIEANKVLCPNCRADAEDWEAV